MVLKLEVLDKVAALVTAAFGLVAALAWNQAITTVFTVYVKPRFGAGSEVLLLLVYAVVVTIVAVVATLWVGRAVVRAKTPAAGPKGGPSSDR